MEVERKGSFIKKKHLIFIAGILSVLLLAGGYLYYRSEAETLRRYEYNTLKSIAELKAGQITQWFRERSGDASTLSESPFLIRAFSRLIENRENIGLKKDIGKRLTLAKNNWGYDNISLVSPAGDLLLSLDPKDSKLDPETSGKIYEALEKKTIVFSDFYYCSIHNRIHIEIIAPVVDEKKAPIAVLVFRIVPEEYLYPFIQSWPTASKTAETLLVRRDGDNVLFLNELRHRKNTALKLRIPLTEKNVPAVQAVLGYEGIFEGRDYRGVDVLSYASHIPGTPWYMVAKTDKKEIYSELYYRAGVVTGFTLLLILLLVAGTSWIYHTRQRDIYKELFIKEKNLREAQEEFRTTLYSIGDAVITTDIKGYIRYMNPVAEWLTGWKETEAKGKPLEEVFQIINEVTRNKTENPVQMVLRKGSVVGLANHTLLISKDGREIPIADSGAPIKDERGETIGVVLVFRDQTEEREAQKSLLKEKTFSETIINSLPGVFYLFDENGHFLRWNRNFETVSGYSSEEMGTMHPLDFFAGEEENPVETAIQEVFEKGESHVEADFISKDGRRTPYYFTGVRFLWDNGLYLAGMGIDITERKRAEKSLQMSEERFRILFENTPLGTGVATLEGNLLTYNEAFLKITGYSEEEMTNFNVRALYTNPEDRGPLLKKLQNNGYARNYEVLLQHKNGTLFYANLAINMITFDGKKALLTVLEDITEQKWAEGEIKKLGAELEHRVIERTAQLEAANKEMEAFSYSVSHDLRAPLRAIDGFAEILLREYSPKLDDEGKRICSIITGNAKKMGQLIDELLALSRLGRTEMRFSSIDMKTLANEAYNELTTPEMQVRIDFQVGDVRNAYGDPTLIRQVWMNLLSNAIKFSSHRERAVISITCSEEEGHAVYCVEDNGAGFNMKYGNKLFGVFQRLHSEREFEGTGVGLAIVKRIVHRHGGRVSARGEVDKGAAFYFSIPIKKVVSGE